MSFAKPESSAYKTEVDVTKCPANGCKLRATVRLEGGAFCCSAHAWLEPEDWSRATSRLGENDWLSGFIDEMQRMDQRSTDWRGFAMQFWENSDKFCQPDKQENAIPYQNRMRGELLYRCGLIPNRPQVRLPQAVKPGGRFAQGGAL